MAGKKRKVYVYDLREFRENNKRLIDWFSNQDEGDKASESSKTKKL